MDLQHTHRKITTLLLCVVLLAGINACQTTAPVVPTKYPVDIKEAIESEDFPLQAAGFKRTRIVLYEPALANYSAKYAYLHPDAQIYADIYIYSKNNLPNDILKQLEIEKATIQHFHPNAVLQSTMNITLNKNNTDHAAILAQYEFNAFFQVRQQTVYSELILLEHGDYYIKLRSTTPVQYKDIASIRNRELMNAVNWIKGLTATPPFNTQTPQR